MSAFYRNSVLFLALGAIVVVFAWSAYSPNHLTDEQDQGESSAFVGSADSNTSTSKAHHIRLEASGLHERMKTAAAHHAAKPAENAAESLNSFPYVPRTRKGMSLEDDPFGATSEAEQAWLDRHGYPNALQMQEYSSASDEQLRAAAESGDEVARTMLNSRELERGTEGAEDALLYAGAMGNSFALELLSSFHSGAMRGDPIFGHALSKVLEWQGNYQISLMRNMSMRAPLSESDRILAESEALMIFNQFLDLRQEIYDQSPPVDPRPGGG